MPNTWRGRGGQEPLWIKGARCPYPAHVGWRLPRTEGRAMPWSQRDEDRRKAGGAAGARLPVRRLVWHVGRGAGGGWKCRVPDVPAECRPFVARGRRGLEWSQLGPVHRSELESGVWTGRIGTFDVRSLVLTGFAVMRGFIVKSSGAVGRDAPTRVAMTHSVPSSMQG